MTAYNDRGEGEKSPAKQSSSITIVNLSPMPNGNANVPTRTFTVGEVTWYKFTASSSRVYGVQWADLWDGPAGNNHTGKVEGQFAFSSGTYAIRVIYE